MSRTLLVTGSREWADAGVIRQALDWARFEWAVGRVVHGDCRGADRIAGELFEQMRGKQNVRAMPAKWKQFGKPAGLLRNQQMLDECNPDLCIAFHDDLANSKGTKDMVRRAIKAGLPVFLVTTTDPDFKPLHEQPAAGNVWLAAAQP